MKLEVQNIYKSFGPVEVLKDVCLTVDEGEVHALVGENGAGKSTLIKIITGVYTKDSGTIKINDQFVEINKVKDSQDLGISYVHQELNVIKEMTILENMFLGNEIKKNKLFLDYEYMYEKASSQLNELGLEINPNEKMKNLTIGYQQMVEIAKALLYDANLIILDEPTAALTNRETEKLFQIIKDLKSKGKSFIYVSHRMEEIFEICDRVTVLRDGKYIGSENIENITYHDLVRMMVGRKIENLIPYEKYQKGKEVLRVEDLAITNEFYDVSFSLYENEVLGFFGLMGSGRSEIMHAIFGSKKLTKGYIYIDNEEIKIKSPRDAKKHGIAFVTEDRKSEGLILDFNIVENVLLPSYKDRSNKGIVDEKLNVNISKDKIEQLNIKTSSEKQKLKNLSGGNQQKVVFAKWLETNPKIFILDEPTRGVDVGSKKEIYTLINYLKANGAAIILVSSELPEVIGISDRIAVMHNNRLVKIIDDRNNFNEEDILNYAFVGGVNNE